MKKYKITFGKGKDSITMTEKGDLTEILNTLKSCGWETKEITNIKESNE